ncbi:MAG TPA: terminase [Hyphomicrobiaceae bacterium]|nr:terminase [Hyphomicrobiaceae bacterium]
MGSAALVDQWSQPLWRINNLYTIKDKGGSAIPFRTNWAQEKFCEDMWFLNLILKARQMGFTTFIQIFMLDACLFNSNTGAGVIAHNRDDAEAFFSDKIKFAYDHLSEGLRSRIPATQDSAKSLEFNNHSRIRVGTSLRSGTFQYLHVSEFGKVCAKYPDKAKEIVTGAFNTVEAGQFIFVESTAEGNSGAFHDMCQKAQNDDKEGRPRTKLDFRFHFYAWWQDSSYRLDEADTAATIITAEDEKYFAAVEAEMRVTLDAGQRAWYVKKRQTQQSGMKREFPSTPGEAFEASVEGAYFVTEMAKVREQGRICKIPILNKPVDVYWDLGVGDAMSLTFVQTSGMEVRIIDYYENSGEGFEHYAKVLHDKGYIYGRHFFPHDGDHRTLGAVAKTKREWAIEAGIKPVEIVPRIPTEAAGIAASRSYLPQCYFDETRTARLIKCLDSYRKDWDDKLGVWKDTARHDEFSHGYKSFETAAVAPRIGISKPINYSNRGIV